MSPLTAPVRLTDQLFIVYSEFPHRDSGNVFLITGREPTLIDCGSRRAVPQLIDNLAQTGVRVEDLAQVIATHGDFDHVQGFHDLHARNPSLQLRIHHWDRPSLQGSDPYRNASYIYDGVYYRFGDEHFLPLEDGEVLPAGDGSLTVYHTPGHTEGSVCLLGTIDHRAILFAGDTIGGAMRSLEGASIDAWVQAAVTWRQSLARLAELDFDWVLNGHEPARSLPLSRAQTDRMMRSFGTMLNPWFLRHEGRDMEEPDLAVADAK